MRGTLVTGGTDRIVKVRNVTEDGDGKRGVSLVTSRDLGVVSPSLRKRRHNMTLRSITGRGHHGGSWASTESAFRRIRAGNLPEKESARRDGANMVMI